MREDPTRTIALRKKFISQINKRLKELKGIIRKAIIEDDCFGIKKDKSKILSLSLVSKLSSPGAKVWQYRNDVEKVEEFVDWLKEQEELGILERVPNTLTGKKDPWTNTYIQTSYQKGILQARSELGALGVNLPSTKDIFEINGVFNQPIHVERIESIFTRVFSDLKGVTEVMDRQISRQLSLGLAEGKGPYEIARLLNNRVDKIGITRARLIARTEIVRTHNVAAMNEFERLESIVGEEILVQWWTALDERVRSSHEDRHGKIYKKKKARGLIGEPNCRCALLPYMKSIDGDPKIVAKRENRLGKIKIKEKKEEKD